VLVVLLVLDALRSLWYQDRTNCEPTFCSGARVRQANRSSRTTTRRRTRTIILISGSGFKGPRRERAKASGASAQSPNAASEFDVPT
jgi:hypothetical protein